MLLLLATAMSASAKSYSSHSLLEIVGIDTEAKADLVRAVIMQRKGTPWNDASVAVGKNFHLVVAPTERSELEAKLSGAGMEKRVISEDVGRLLKEERRQAEEDCFSENSQYEGEFSFNAVRARMRNLAEQIKYTYTTRNYYIVHSSIIELLAHVSNIILSTLALLNSM